MIEISFVIPAFNEAHNIDRTIECIENACEHADITYEIVVVDNGSSDGTLDLARSLGATALLHLGDTVGTLRNLGVAATSGHIIGFIDADVSLTSEWAENINPVLELMRKNELLISGSHCSPPESSNLLLKHWFRTLALDPRNTHLGTGHLLVSRNFFLSLGGFNTNLKTGEDYDFCSRAKLAGGSVAGAPLLRVIHHEFPTSLYKFMRRESWHGKGDLFTLSAAIRSKVILASLAFLGLHALLAAGLVLKLNKLFFVNVTLLLILLLLLSSWIKSKHMSLKTVIINAGISYFYFWGRVWAIAEVIAEKARHKRAYKDRKVS